MDLNTKRTAIQIIKEGQILLEHGPVTMVLMAYKDEEPLTKLCEEAAAVVESALEEIAASLTYLRLAPGEIPDGVLTGLALKMKEAVSASQDPQLTPMAAVAGAIAQETADWLYEQGASRVIINNGGDIALRLSAGEVARLGIISDLDSGAVDRIMTITAESGIGGIATSGLGGRGFTRGIANALTVFSPDALLADALATQLANQTYVESEKVSTVKAGKIDPFSDIAELDVVVEVGHLSDEELDRSILQLKREAEKHYSNNLLYGVIANIQGKRFSYPEDFAEANNLSERN